jgi:xylan 1,4-beta-xylosidase
MHENMKQAFDTHAVSAFQGLLGAHDSAGPEAGARIQRFMVPMHKKKNDRRYALGFVGILATICVAAPLACAAAESSAVYHNPVLAGDYPDPSVIRVGKEYWATATSSEWGPQFPLLHSRDLVNWKVVGAVFPKRPAWAVANFWAPEISEYRGRYSVYYVGRRIDGPLSVAVATADKPEGPYTDHGPLVSQEAGSIDPMAVADEKGERYLIWKEDGNSRKLPTVIWAQKLTADGAALVGDKKELIRNDSAWEGAVVEGPFVLRRGDWFYLFYSGSGCCGRGCAYALGAARSRALLGPWEKNPANPILAGNDHWKCPGHGSIVTDERGRFFLLYHAYDARTFVYTGREMLLDEVKFGDDGWPTMNGGQGPTSAAPSPLGITQTRRGGSFFDDFTSEHVGPRWQWPQGNEPSLRLDPANGGQLVLAPTADHASDPIGAVLAWPTVSGDYEAIAVIDAHGLKLGALAGLSAFGDPGNALGVAVGEGKALVWRREKNQHRNVAELAGVIWPSVYLRLTATGGDRFQFAVSSDGLDWKNVGDPAEGAYLPPWDRSVRVALTVGGVVGAEGRFNSFRITPATKDNAEKSE